jgi:hypothetical protein
LFVHHFIPDYVCLFHLCILPGLLIIRSYLLCVYR